MKRLIPYSWTLLLLKLTYIPDRFEAAFKEFFKTNLLQMSKVNLQNNANFRMNYISLTYVCQKWTKRSNSNSSDFQVCRYQEDNKIVYLEKHDI